MKRWTLEGLSLTSAMLVAASMASTPPAAADEPAPEAPAAVAGGYNDRFHVNMGSGKCVVLGVISFIDYGPGVPGNGKSNDDYIEVWDTCGNKHGVKGWAWKNGRLLGAKYNGKGDERRVIWDPFGNVKKGDGVGIKICEVDGPNDRTPGPCNSGTVRSVDG